MSFEIDIPFKVSSNSELDKLAAYYYRRLFQMVLSLYEWKGDDIDNKDIDPNYLEWKLMTFGYAGLTDVEGKKRASEITRVGYDWYQMPVYGEIVNPTLKKSITRYFGKDCVLVKNNKLLLPTREIIKHYAIQMAQAEISFKANLQNSTNIGLYIVDNDPQAQQIRAMLDQKAQGEPNVIVKKNILGSLTEEGSNTLPFIGTPSNFIGDKLEQIKSEIMNQFWYQFGINTNGGNMLKSQYNNLDETNGNNSQLLINRAYWLEERQRACDEYNKMYNSNLTVDIRKGVEINNEISNQTEFIEGQNGMSIEPEV